MDNPGILLQRLALCVHTVERLPLIHMDMDTDAPVKTAPRPLLEMYVVLQGELDFTAATRQSRLTTGDVLFTCATHGNQARVRSTDTRYSCTSLDISQVPQLDCPSDLFLVAQGMETERIHPQLGELFFAHHAEPDPLQPVKVKQVYLGLLLSLSEQAAPGDGSAYGQDPRVRQCIRTLQEHHYTARSSSPTPAQLKSLTEQWR